MITKLTIGLLMTDENKLLVEILNTFAIYKSKELTYLYNETGVFKLTFNMIKKLIGDDTETFVKNLSPDAKEYYMILSNQFNLPQA